MQLQLPIFPKEAQLIWKRFVNPQYRRLTHQIKKLREKKQRVEAKFYPLVEQAREEKLENIPAITDKQMQYKQQIDQLTSQENELIIARKNLQPKIKLAKCPRKNAIIN